MTAPPQPDFRALLKRSLAAIAQLEGKLAAVERADLIRLRTASANLGCPHDWMLELHLAPGADPADCVNAQACAEWLGDLRLLGMRPAVVAVDSSGPREERG